MYDPYFSAFFNVLAIWIAYIFIPGFVVSGGIKEFAVAGILLGLFNLIIKPIIKFISAPIILLTLGLFTLVINAFLILVVDYLLDFVTIQTFGALFWTMVVVGVTNVIATSIIKSVRHKEK